MRVLTAVSLVVLTLFAAGCGAKLPDAVNKPLQQVNQQVQQTVESAKNQVLPAGIELTTTPPIKASTCYGQFTPPSVKYPAVLILSSYRDGTPETYPAIYAQIRTPVASLDQYKGKTVEASIFYVRRSAEDPVLESKDPVQLKVESVQGKTIVCQITKGAVVDVQTGDSYPFLGKFTAEVE